MATSLYEDQKQQALHLIRQGQFEECVAVLESIIAEHGVQADLLDMQGMCNFRLEHLEQAAACYSQLSDLDPSKPNPLTNLGAVYNRMKRFDQAVEVLQKAIKCDNKKIDAYYNLGIAHRKSGHSSLALSAYKEAIKLNPQFEQAHLNIANVYLDMNNTAMATTHYRTALTITPELESAQRGLKKVQEQELLKNKHKKPFGRLVDTSQLSHKKSSSAIRELTDVERAKDREEVIRLAKGIRNAARHVSEEIREQMEPVLLALTRAVIDGEQHPELVADTHTAFREEIAKFQEGHRYLKRSVLELRGHEEVMNTPDLESLE
ncbi:MAG: tetratricopeptide repeat protein [Planctomycetaceae bacterium]|nr:tetratricopeptide repeat protein [Planctomycetaceae bacterium]